MANAVNDQKKSVNRMADDFSNKAQDTGNQLSRFVYDSGEKIGSFASDVAGSAVDSVRTSRDYVKKNPYKGVAIAAASGLVVGALLSMLMARNKN